MKRYVRSATIAETAQYLNNVNEQIAKLLESFDAFSHYADDITNNEFRDMFDDVYDELLEIQENISEYIGKE